MTADIVERLGRDLMEISYDDIEAMVREAADELERLGHLAAIVREQGFEIERLRAALTAIAALPAVDGLDQFEVNRRGQEFRLNEQAREIARRALEPKP